VVLDHLHLHVDGMDCADEAGLIRRALAADRGVVALDFDLVAGRVAVAFDPAVTSSDTIVAAVARTGLRAHVGDRPHAPAATHEHDHRHAGSRWMLAAVGLMLAGWALEIWLADDWVEGIFGHYEGGWGHVHTRAAVALYALSLAAGLGPVIPRALASLRFLRFDMHVLVCLSAIGAAAIGQWAEAAAVASLFALAHRMEAWSIERARAAIGALVDDRTLGGDDVHQSAPVERWIERFAAIYTPAVTLAAALVAIGPPLMDGQWDVWFYRALIFLVLACPCALVISTPVTVVAALTSAARRGVLVRGGGPLERAALGVDAARSVIESGEAVLLPGGGGSAEFLARHAYRALAVIRQNVALALLTKAAFLVSAVLGVAPLWMAVLADTGATVLVTLNGLRLLGAR